MNIASFLFVLLIIALLFGIQSLECNFAGVPPYKQSGGTSRLHSLGSCKSLNEPQLITPWLITELPPTHTSSSIVIGKQKVSHLRRLR